MSKLQHYVIGLMFLSVLGGDHKTNQDISNLNRTFWNKSGWAFYGFTFTTLLERDYQFEKWYLHLNLHTYLASCIYDFFDRSQFQQNIWAGEKNLYKSISKSIYADTYLLFVIMVTECDVLSPSAKFHSLNHKNMVVLRA